MSLSEAFIQPMLYVRQYLQAPEGDASLFRERLQSYLHHSRIRAQEEGESPAAIDAAMYAVVAWMDEAILCSAWDGAATWRREPLQAGYFNTVCAGVDFFDRLSALSPEADGVRKVYLLCLALGFEGRYAGPAGQAALMQIRMHQLRTLHGEVWEASQHLFPEAYPRPSLTPTQQKRWLTHGRFTTIVVPLAILAALYGILNWVLYEYADIALEWLP
ncbi:DotU family type IV/VI secretion system protein [Edwardsiella anguillarum]|uniref:DotU family type IV/VI secretion system protein n=1 Tax=Edwardsiella anguillarum TaxID=1821960 RepID=UPI00054CBA68|nr:DotU family type IV/VI secretion system protein [Edwardsiella anguillarum]